MAHDVMHAQRRGLLGSAVAAAVVDDEILDDVEARNALRQIAYRALDAVRFVVARDLDDQLHVRLRPPPLRTRHNTMVQGSGRRTVTMSKRLDSRRVKPSVLQRWRCPGVLPHDCQYLPLA